MHPGTRLGRYEIVGLIGQGGMGEVWRARDTSLGRDVAIKMLPPSLSQERERLARLTREASLLASVNHPNIAVIHGLEEHDGTRFIVLELVDGETLAERIGRGPIAVADALKLARQIAEGLEAAHAQGVIHRDLKPANIKMASDGRAMVLDFGLAKAPARGDDHAATRTAMATAEGMVMGTPAYMSPEQARGEPAGVQSDIWSLGVVIYEMLTGVSPYKRSSGAESIAALLSAPPDFSKLPSQTPAAARRLLTRCLERDRDRRTHHVSDARLDIEEAERELTAPATSAASASNAWRWIAVVAIALAIGLSGWFASRTSVVEAPRDQVRLSMSFTGRPTNLPVGATSVAISPDGSRVVFAAQTRLWIRNLKESEPTLLATDAAVSNPFVSPDGRWVGYFVAAEVKKVPVAGGPAVAVVATSNRPSGATWHGDTIVFATTQGLHQVSAGGGAARLLKAPDRSKQERLYAWPQFLPGGKTLLLTIVSDPGGTPQVALLNLDTLELRSLVAGASSARYDGHGALIYASGSQLRAVRFDAASGTISGEPLPLTGIAPATAPDNGAANFAIASNGTMVFASTQVPANLRRLTWFDRRGTVESLPFGPHEYVYPRVSPDGKRIAVERRTAGNRDVWIIDLARGTETQLTDGPTEDMFPVWSPDGQRIWFSSDRGGNFDIYSQAANGASAARLELSLPELQFTQAFSPDGTKLVIYDRFRDTTIFDLSKPGAMQPLLDRPEFDQRMGQISPDGNWIAYESDESGGRVEIFVRPFPNVNERREQISVSGGRYPLWGPKGSNELYYMTADGSMTAVSVRSSPTFAITGTTKLFDRPKPIATRSGIPYDVSPLDRRFLFAVPVQETVDSTTQLTVILNFTESLVALRQSRP